MNIVNELNNIRIGNDIRLYVTIPDTYKWDNNNIKAVRAFLINTSLRDAVNKAWGMPPRFPRDPQSKFFRPGPRHLNRCGYPHYHAWPMDHDPNYVFDDGFHRPFFYHGFGLEPGRWPHRWFGWTRRHEPGFGDPSFLDPVDLHIDADYTFQTPAKALDGQRRVEVFFPAQDQLACGTYKLVLVVTVYEAGWGRDNLHTYTIDKGNVFSLTDSDDGLTGNIDINADDRSFESSTLSDIQPTFGHFYVTEGLTLKLGEMDAHFNNYYIDCRVNGGDWVRYHKDGWRYEQLTFESADPDICAVKDDGSLQAASYDPLNNTTIVHIYNTHNTLVTGKFIVSVVESSDMYKMAYAVFSNEKVPSEINPDSFTEIHTDATIDNEVDHRYLWLKTARPLKTINVGDDQEVVGVTSSRFHVPMEKPVIYNNFYYYRSSAKIKAGDMTIHLEF